MPPRIFQLKNIIFLIQSSTESTHVHGILLKSERVVKTCQVSKIKHLSA